MPGGVTGLPATAKAALPNGPTGTKTLPIGITVPAAWPQ